MPGSNREPSRRVEKTKKSIHCSGSFLSGFSFSAKNTFGLRPTSACTEKNREKGEKCRRLRKKVVERICQSRWWTFGTSHENFLFCSDFLFFKSSSGKARDVDDWCFSPIRFLLFFLLRTLQRRSPFFLLFFAREVYNNGITRKERGRKKSGCSWCVMCLLSSYKNGGSGSSPTFNLDEAVLVKRRRLLLPPHTLLFGCHTTVTPAGEILRKRFKWFESLLIFTHQKFAILGKNTKKRKYFLIFRLYFPSYHCHGCLLLRHTRLRSAILCLL